MCEDVISSIKPVFSLSRPESPTGEDILDAATFPPDISEEIVQKRKAEAEEESKNSTERLLHQQQAEEIVSSPNDRIVRHKPVTHQNIDDVPMGRGYRRKLPSKPQLGYLHCQWDVSGAIKKNGRKQKTILRR